MPAVVVAPSAAEALERLLTTRDLPADARRRFLDRLRQLERFPESGRSVGSGPAAGSRVLTGPWWFISVYEYDRTGDAVHVTAVLDGRTGAAAGALS